ncbi:MAG: glycosyltransferase family 4 protein [Nanoarchaeota archaeon]
MIKPNGKLKLLLAADTYYPKVDGVLMFMEEFMKRAQFHFTLSLLVPKFNAARTPAQFKPVPTTFLDLSPRLRLLTYNSIRFSSRNRKRISQAVQQADIIFIQELGPVGFLALRAARRQGKKVLLYIHNTPWEFLEKYFSLNRLNAFLLRKFFVYWYNRADRLLIPYPELEGELRKAGVQTSISVARLGVDIKRFFPTQRKSRWKKKLHLPPIPLIGYVGRISKEKNTLLLLKAMPQLKRKALLLMVGDGEERLVQKFKGSSQCRVTGFIPNVEEYLKAIDIFVMPSLTETTSLATLEALASGLPVLVTKVGYPRRYIHHGQNGLFFPRRSATVLAERIDQLLADPTSAARLGRQARRTAVSLFSWNRSIKTISKLILKTYTSYT